MDIVKENKKQQVLVGVMGAMLLVDIIHGKPQESIDMLGNIRDNIENGEPAEKFNITKDKDVFNPCVGDMKALNAFKEKMKGR